MEFVGKIGDEIEKNLFIKRISEKLGIDQSLLKREVHRKEGHVKPRGVSATSDVKLNVNPLEVNLIRLLLEYPQKTEQIQREKILDFFLEPALKDLGEKIVQAYKLLGYIDINVILSTDDDKKLRENLYKLSIEAPPTDENRVERNFDDNIRRIKEKWYKEQHRQLKIRLAQAQQIGNDGLLQQLMVEKQNLMRAERELR
jgi:DNA primase